MYEGVRNIRDFEMPSNVFHLMYHFRLPPVDGLVPPPTVGQRSSQVTWHMDTRQDNWLTLTMETLIVCMVIPYTPTDWRGEGLIVCTHMMKDCIHYTLTGWMTGEPTPPQRPVVEHFTWTLLSLSCLCHCVPACVFFFSAFRYLIIMIQLFFLYYFFCQILSIFNFIIKSDHYRCTSNKMLCIIIS